MNILSKYLQMTKNRKMGYNISVVKGYTSNLRIRRRYTLLKINGYSSYDIIQMVLEEIRESIKEDPNLTQQDLANQLGISRSYLNKMLNWNVKNLNGEDLILIMYRLNMIRGVR